MAPKITVHKNDTPSEQVIKQANKTHAVIDAQGRTIGIKKLGAFDRLKLLETVGAENCKNEPYLGYASVAFHVTSIDGEEVLRPTNLRQLEALVQRLDDDGIEAVAKGIQEHFPAADLDKDAVKN